MVRKARKDSIEAKRLLKGGVGGSRVRGDSGVYKLSPRERAAAKEQREAERQRGNEKRKAARVERENLRSTTDLAPTGTHPVVRIEQPNPFDWAVKRLGLTRNGFGQIADLGKPYLLRLSQGRHARIGATAMHHLYDQASKKGVDLDAEVQQVFGQPTLEEAWEWWVYAHRQAQSLPKPAKGSGNPFSRLVKAAGGVARMAALLAVPDPLVERYAKGITAQMPGPIEEALNDMKYQHTEHLRKAVIMWHTKR